MIYLLHIRYAQREVLSRDYKMLRHHPTHFYALFDESWLEEDWAQRAVRDIDHIPPEKSIHQALWDRGITYQQLSGGVKTLLLIRHMDGLFEFERMGYNCYPYLMEIADMREVFVGMSYVHSEFDDNIIKGRAFEYLNTGAIMHTQDELLEEMFKGNGEGDC